MPSTVNPRRHFLPWDRPLLPQVAAWLARDWRGEGPLDLSDMLAIVPTRQSGRRLREALAEHASARGAAVFPPLVRTPDTLLAQAVPEKEAASRLEALLAWTEVLRATDLGEFAAVFPVAPPRQDFAWAWRLAESLARLQTQLAENGLAFAEVVSRATEDFPEQDRWLQLAELERRQVQRLRELGKREPHAARRDAAAEASPPENVRRIVLLAAADPLPVAITLLARWAETSPVDVAVFAPENEADAFDAWGRPLPEHWSARVLALPDFPRHVRLCANPSAEAERAAAIARDYAPEPDGMIALGVADPESLPLLENALSRAGLAGYNPEGRLRRAERLHGLLTALAAIARESSFDAVAALARCPDFLACLRARCGANFSSARFLANLDDVRAEHLPADLPALREAARASAPELLPALGVVEELCATLARGLFPENVIAALALIFGDRRFDLAQPEQARAAEDAAAWREVLRDCATAREAFSDIAPREWWDVALRFFGESRRTEDKPAGALDLQGWLELLWEDAPHLVVSGLNDGLVPEAIVGDAFLPESLRERLGLKTNAARFARDAYLLQAIVGSRAGASGAAAGQVDLLLAKTSSAGDPLRPSRLLLRCPDEELPERVAWLFRPADAMRKNLPWTRGWKLTPPRVAPPARVAVTGLRAWLACPFRFYLGHVLKMEPVDPAKTELDARDFGTLCHAALEAMANDAAMRDAADERALRDFLLAHFDAAARAQFGGELTLPLVVQFESARQRLSRVAAVQAAERAAGWRIERAETKFTLPLGGLEIAGKIDRIDVHEPSGAWRVLDYKTSDRAITPQQAHLRAVRVGDERRPAWLRVMVGNRELVWQDLQLPLYLRALALEGRGGNVAAGYFNLPKAVGETGVEAWHELTPDLLDAALRCAEAAAAAVHAGEFWPPAEIAADRDPFGALFHHGAEDSVDWRTA